MIPTLQTERLTLRALEEKDFPEFRDFFASERAQYYGGPITADLSWRRMAAYLGHWGLRGYGPWALEDKASGDFVGMCGGWCPEGWSEPEITYFLTEAGAGRGLACEAARASLRWLYTERGWTTAISATLPANEASRRVAQRCGATFEGETHIEPYGRMNVYRYPASEPFSAKATE